jgi:hypothetical protein
MKRVLLLVVSLLTLGFAAACNSPQAAAVSGLAVELASLARTPDGNAVATIRIRNPNVVAYNVAESEHRIHVNGRQVGTVKIRQPTGVPAQSNAATQTGTLEGAASLPSGTADYRMESKLVLRLYGETTQDLKLTSSGSVTIE